MTPRNLALVAVLFTATACDDHILGDPIITDTAGGNLYTSDWAGVQEFFAQRCETCHIEGGSGDFDLTVEITAQLGGGTSNFVDFVVPGNAGGSILWQSVAHSGTALPMPLGASSPLGDVEIKHIEEWINAGAEL